VAFQACEALCLHKSGSKAGDQIATKIFFLKKQKRFDTGVISDADYQELS
jgi:hypothetical protein